MIIKKNSKLQKGFTYLSSCSHYEGEALVSTVIKKIKASNILFTYLALCRHYEGEALISAVLRNALSPQ